MELAPNPRISEYPRYSHASMFLRLMDGRSGKTLNATLRTLWEHRGTPQANADWSDPETWIPNILAGDERVLALYLWRDSHELINPRFVGSELRFCTVHQLLETDRSGIMHLTEMGHDFLAGRITAQIDY